MKFTERVATFFGRIKVVERNGLVRVTGIDGMVMKRHIRKLWETEVINKHLFTTISDTSFSFNTFYTPDITYILQTMYDNPDCPWSGKNTLKKVIDGIMENTWYKCSTAEVKSMVDDSRMKLLKWKAMPKQLEFLHLFGDKMPRYDLRGYILALSPGGGKSIGMDDLIRTPYGWVKNRNLKLGQDIIAPDGTITKVCGIYPQGELDMYKVTFEDGRSVECSDDHLWKVYNRGWYNGKGAPMGAWRVVKFQDLRTNMANHPDVKYYVPLVSPEIRKDTKVPIDPYLLGVILGDGNISHKNVSITKPDKFIRNAFVELLPIGNIVTEYCNKGKTFRITGRSLITGKSIKDYLTELQLFGKTSPDKFIPEGYFNGSFQQKLALLQGLLDTDGTVSENGSISFCTTSKKLALQVQELVRSIGGLAKLRIRHPKYTYKGEVKEGREAYQINIRYHTPRDMFRLPRKREATPENYQYADTFRLRIRNIEYVGKKEAQCIAVEHPDRLYITNDYIVTHNTFTDLLVATCVVPPSVAEVKIIISPKKALHLVWEKSIKEVFHKVPTYWCSDSGIKMPLKDTEYYIFNFEQLDQAVQLGKQLALKNTRYFVIVDESHNFADYRSARTKKLIELQTIRDDIYFIWTSGSPILKEASELISFLRCADHRFNQDAEMRFKKIYSANSKRALEIFNHRLGQMMAYVVPKSAFSQNKPPVIRELPVKLPSTLANRYLMSTVREDMKQYIVERLKFYEGEMKKYRDTVSHWLYYHESTLTTKIQQREFDQYRKYLKIIARNPDRMMVELLPFTRTYERSKLIPSLPPMNRRDFKAALSAIKSIKLKVRGEALGKVLSARRAECTAALALYCKPTEIIKESLSKTLFFSAAVLPVATLAKYLEEEGFNPMMVYGGTNARLTQMIEQFTYDPNINPICATMRSLSEAVPVTAASTVVLLDRPFRQAAWDQVVARADRLGQQFPVTVIEVTLDTGGLPNVSTRTDEILANVRELINVIVGPSFAGPDPSDREYAEAIDASIEDPDVETLDDILARGGTS